MENWKSASKKTSAFTIVELLTVMAVIAILIGLLVPALALVKDFAKEMEQRAQFHSLEVAGDMFAADSGYGTYPPSDDNMFDPSPPGAPLGPDPKAYCGAQKLAEAVVGWDLLGYHPDSAFRSDGQNAKSIGGIPTVYQVYDPSNPITGRENVEERKGPFIELENANAFMVGDIYNNIGSFNPDNYVLCDVYAEKRTGQGGAYGGKRTGMPILFYCARTEYFNQDSTDVGVINDDIYYYRDNMNLLALGTPDGASTHILDGADNAADWLRFEDMILNPQIDPTLIKRPYRANSYILISAGKDGIYGTGDDLTNFTKD